jgi:16S rRNA (uracil1498-N3)-methyltransferase
MPRILQDRRMSKGRMSGKRAKVRLFVEQVLRQETEIAVGATQAHYLTRVMRLQSKDRVRLFNGRDGEWLARITSVSRSWCELVVESMLREQRTEPGPALAFAPIKKDPMHYLIEKATELGVERLLPVTTRNTVVEQVNLDRMYAQVIKAAEQCGRLTIPHVGPPKPLDALLAEWPETRPLLFMDERASGRQIAEAIAACATRSPGPSLPPGILVGPEGGFAEAEAEALRALGFVMPVSLGPRILRAETAALAALACWQAFAGDWRAANESE